MVARRFNSQHPGKIIRRSQRKQGVGRGSRATVVSGPPTASYPKYPPGFDRKPQGPLWACLVGYPQAHEVGWHRRAHLDRTFGRRELLSSSHGPAMPPLPSAQLLGEHPAWGLVRSLSSARLPRAGGGGAHSPGLRPGSPRRLSKQPQVRGSGIRCPCSALSSAAAFLSML